MAVDTDTIKATYPLPSYNYRVTIQTGGESLAMSFAEVSGLSLSYEPVTYKHGLSYLMGNRIIPGMRQPITLTLKRGIVQANDFLYSWINDTYTQPFFRDAKRDIVVDLCDEAGEALVRWTVQGALPTKLDSSAFDANSNEVAIETLELTAHGLKVEYVS